MKQLFSVINRFETASSYWRSWHTLNLRIKKSNSMISSMLEAAEGYLKEELIREIDLGIAEYQQWKLNQEKSNGI